MYIYSVPSGSTNIPERVMQQAHVTLIVLLWIKMVDRQTNYARGMWRNLHSFYKRCCSSASEVSASRKTSLTNPGDSTIPASLLSFLSLRSWNPDTSGWYTLFAQSTFVSRHVWFGKSTRSELMKNPSFSICSQLKSSESIFTNRHRQLRPCYSKLIEEQGCRDRVQLALYLQ